MSQRDTLLHLFAGGCGGTVGAIVTCPLEVIKTRLQSSGLALRAVYFQQVQLGISGAGVMRPAASMSPGLLQVLKSILEKEGPRSLFRGLGPNLVGVAPSRALYFASYSRAKEFYNGVFVPNSNIVHMFSAGSAASESLEDLILEKGKLLTHHTSLQVGLLDCSVLTGYSGPMHKGPPHWWWRPRPHSSGRSSELQLLIVEVLRHECWAAILVAEAL